MWILVKFVQVLSTTCILQSTDMFKHYLVVTIRNLRIYLNYTILNIGGLATGLVCVIFILIYINDELSYDRFHKDYQRIFRANRLYNSNNVNEDAATCSFPFAPNLQLDYPDMVAYTCRFFNFMRDHFFIEYRKSENEIIKFNESNFFLVDSTVFDVFTFPLIKGDPATALDRPNTVVLTESTAKRYFGTDDPLGKTLIVEEGLNFEVTGVMKDLPPQSHFTIDILGSMSTFKQLLGGQLPSTWIWNPCWTYIKLHENVNPEDLQARLPDFYLNHYDDLKNQDVTLTIQALKDIHLKSHHDYEMHANSDVIYVYILSAIGVIVLILACINFMNMTTARSATRIKEIGVKKVFGSSRRKLILQFIGETVVLSFLALLIATVVVEILLQLFNNFTGKNISGLSFLYFNSILAGFGLVILVGLLAGSYPAFYLSAFNPIKVFRGGLKGVNGSGSARKILVVLQFSISVTLIIGTMIVFRQLRYLSNADIGFRKEQVIIIPSVNQVSFNYDSFREKLLTYPAIEHVTGMEDILGVNHNTRQVTIEGLSEEQSFWYPMFMVRYDFLETFDIKVLAGRGFSTEIASDTINAIMINETMARNLGWTNEEAIGKRITSDGNERVIGVFGDFHVLSLHEPINNFILDMSRNSRGAAGLTSYIAVRVNTEKYGPVLKNIENVWNEFAPTRPFEYSFIDEELDNLYRNEEKFGKFSVLLTVLALFIASLGLVGLISFIAEQRTKEIGIRRVMGGSMLAIIRLLSFEFVILILIANLIACPVAYLISYKWLNNFTERVTISPLLFIFAGVATLILALIITSGRAFIASSRNPAETLRYE